MATGKCRKKIMTATKDKVKIVLVSAVASGQGKTTVTAALARKLMRQGVRVRIFKTGADFLDPLLLERACGAPVLSLDLWMVGIDQCRSQLAQAAREVDVILIEGVMGLYDGTPSSADLARALGVPVVAVIDASAMAQTCGAVLLGLREYGPVDLLGVMANRVDSSGHANMIEASLRTIPLLAWLPTQHQSLPERQLGLVLPAEVDDLEALLNRLADALVLDTDQWHGLRATELGSVPAPLPAEAVLTGKTIAIARDAAFAFIYPANLDCLRDLGATLCFFSPLQNMPVPEHADAVYLPGGYPELHARTLSKATDWQRSLHRTHAEGKPIWAECGGLMTTVDTLIDIDGHAWPMAGLLPGRVTMQTRLAGIGPQVLVTPDGVLRGHSFHYSRLHSDVMPTVHTTRNPDGAEGEALYRYGSLCGSYFHAYFPSCPSAAAGLFSRRLSA